MIASRWHGGCGIRTDQTVHCWPTGTGQVTPSPAASGKFEDWTEFFHGTCGVRADGTVHCPHSQAGQGHHITPGKGAFTRISGHPAYIACVLRADSTADCWGEYGGGGAPPPPEGHYSDLSARYSGACGLRTDRTVVCWGDDSFGQTEALEGEFSVISRGWTHTCGLRTNGTIDCWGENDGGQLDAPEGKFIDVAAGGANIPTGPNSSAGPSGFGCGVRTDNTIECWGSPLGAVDPPNHKYTQVAAGYELACGLRTDQSITCWVGERSSDRYQPITVPGPFHAINKNGDTCGIRIDNTAVCWSDYYSEDRNPHPKTVAGERCRPLERPIHRQRRRHIPRQRRPSTLPTVSNHPTNPNGLRRRQNASRPVESFLVVYAG